MCHLPTILTIPHIPWTSAILAPRSPRLLSKSIRVNRFFNKLVTGKIRIVKEDARKPEDWPEDDLSYRVQGATFTIRNEALGLSYQLVTDETGVATSPLIPFGEWVIFESEPAIGYLPSEEQQVAIIDANTTETLTFTFSKQTNGGCYHQNRPYHRYTRTRGHH